MLNAIMPDSTNVINKIGTARNIIADWLDGKVLSDDDIRHVRIVKNLAIKIREQQEINLTDNLLKAMYFSKPTRMSTVLNIFADRIDKEAEVILEDDSIDMETIEAVTENIMGNVITNAILEDFAEDLRTRMDIF